MKLREAVGEALRRRRQAQGRTLREVAETLAAIEAVPVPAIGFLPPPRPRAAAAPVPASAPMAPVLDLRAFAGRRTA